jgi:general transcription factor 3C polypeptide 3 (transcription factor C subunit 4)
MKLAEIYEIMGEPRKALDLVYEGKFSILYPLFFSKMIVVIDCRKKRGKSNAANQTEDAANPSTTSLFSEDKATHRPKAASSRAQNRLTHAQLRALEVQKEKEVVKGYRRLKEIWSGMLAGEKESEREWLLEAEKLIDMFRETRNLFVTSRVC